MGEKKSCSACCGVFNLNMNDAERGAWIQENTDIFLSRNISNAEVIVNYRKEREAVTLKRRRRDDIYVCPFVGYIKDNLTVYREDALLGSGRPSASMRTGCLLHPQGSPHPQIGLWPHPQNFSFYGEGICLSYDCLAKERRAHSAAFFRWAETTSLFNYARLASDHTLHRALAAMPLTGIDPADFYTKLAGYYAEYAVVTTSFEDVEKALPATPEELCTFLAMRIKPEMPADIAPQLLSTLSQNFKKTHD